MKTIARLALLLAFSIGSTAVTMMASDASVVFGKSSRAISDDCAKKRARGKKCDDDSSSNRNRNANSNSNSNGNPSNRESNSNGPTNKNSNQNRNSHNKNSN